jgi:SEC-C motif
VLLVAASHLTDAGNGVELVEARGDGRTADMRIHVSAATTVNTEVKTPRSLIRRDVPLTLDDARKIVRKQMRSARAAVGGQLDPSSPGVLIIGGFGMYAADQKVLTIAAREELQRRGASTNHILGIALVSLGAVLGAAHTANEISLTGAAHTEIVGNPLYAGVVSLHTAQVPGMTAMSDVLPLTYEEERKVGRNDPCWCGSGTKFKRCHGA